MTGNGVIRRRDGEKMRGSGEEKKVGDIGRRRRDTGSEGRRATLKELVDVVSFV
jgi:hypothetical protein